MGKRKKKSQADRISHLAEAIDDARLAALNPDPGPAAPTDLPVLLGRLLPLRDELPQLYQEAFFDPYVAFLQTLSRVEFSQILLNANAAQFVLDIAQCILQNGEGFEQQANEAFQEVVSDLFNGFLSAGSRLGVKPPDQSMIPPMVKFGNPDSGPYTFTIGATAQLGLQTGLVSLPPANARGGMLAWTALGHETAGHDILHADTGLLGELRDTVRTEVNDADVGDFLPEYWAQRIDETGSDALGVLHIGPAAGIGLIGYFRGLNAAFSGVVGLRNRGGSGPHPADILRGFLGAECVRHLAFDGSDEWADLILAETEKDVTTIVLEGNEIDSELAKKSAEAVARVVVSTPMVSLENHALCEIMNWTNDDEAVVDQIKPFLTTNQTIPDSLASGLKAAHAVSAATMSALSGEAPIDAIFQRMLLVLQTMHAKNPVNSPLMIAEGDLVQHRVFEPEHA